MNYIDSHLKKEIQPAGKPSLPEEINITRRAEEEADFCEEELEVYRKSHSLALYIILSTFMP